VGDAPSRRNGVPQTGKWQKQLLDEELSERARLAQARTSMLSVRVRDESVRNLVAAVKQHSFKASMCKSEQEGDAELYAMVRSLNDSTNVSGKFCVSWTTNHKPR